jgi:hypothetical protein
VSSLDARTSNRLLLLMLLVAVGRGSDLKESNDEVKEGERRTK